MSNNKYFICFILVVVFVLLGCNKQDKKETLSHLLETFNKDYFLKKEELFFPQDLFSHFPDNIDSLPAIQSYGTEDYRRYHYYILSCYNCNSDSLINMKINSEQIKCNFGDSILFTMKEDDSLSVIIENITKGRIPIPDFKSIDLTFVDEGINKTTVFSEKTMSGLNHNYNFYVLAYDFYENPKNKDLINRLPRTHNKGYSQGIAINVADRSVIYWTMIFEP